MQYARRELGSSLESSLLTATETIRVLRMEYYDRHLTIEVKVPVPVADGQKKHNKPSKAAVFQL